MTLNRYRGSVTPWLQRAAGPFLGWSPSRLSFLALTTAALAGGLAAAVRWTTPMLFLGVAVLVVLSGFWDALDGEVARQTGRASIRGDFLDHVLDRYADVVVLVGIAISGWADPALTLLALVSLLLTSYMGTQAQAVGQGRMYGGLVGRADRLVILAAACFLEFDWSLPWPWAPSRPWERFSAYGVHFTVLDVAMLLLVVTSQWTALSRAVRTYRRLPPSP
ncbi:MAG: CDP-alcohol phosphatidyltransferase family protein [Thermoplasmata archaeon]